MEDTIQKIFLLSALLIAAAYFVGVATDVNAFSAGATKLIYAVTGRDSKGQFAAYPKGASGKIQSF
jgi:hypothetical protein